MDAETSPIVEESAQDTIERDRRTVFCTQFAARLETKELANFFEPCGKVRDVRMVVDKVSGRSKGIAYVEFYEVEAVAKAIALTGQKLLGIPIIVQPTDAERNRVAQAKSDKVPDGYTRIFVGSLPFELSEEGLRSLFEPFGPIESVSLQVNPDTMQSKGFGHVQFKQAAHARAAMDRMNGHKYMGRVLRVQLMSDKTGIGGLGGAPEASGTVNFDDSELEGVSMNSMSRTELMLKLARNDSQLIGATVKPAAPAVVRMPAIETRCVLLKNMFNPENETEPTWVKEIEEEVREECSKFGSIVHVAVDPESRGFVYLKFETLRAAQAAVRALNGRFFAGAQIEALHMPDQIYDAQHPSAAGL